MAALQSRNSTCIFVGIATLAKVYHKDFGNLIKQRFPDILIRSSIEPTDLMFWLNSTDELEYIDRILDISGLLPLCLEHKSCSMIIFESMQFAQPHIYDLVFKVLCDHCLVHRFIDSYRKLCIWDPYHAIDLEIYLFDIPLEYIVYATVFDNVGVSVEEIRQMFSNNYLQLRFFERFNVTIGANVPVQNIAWTTCSYIFKLNCDGPRNAQNEIIDFCVYTLPSVEIKRFSGVQTIELWIAHIDDLHVLQRLCYEKNVYCDVGELPFHRLILKCGKFKEQMALMFNMLSRNSVRFAVIDLDGSIMLHNAIDYFRICDILEDCDLRAHLTSVALGDCRDYFAHYFPEQDMIDLAASDLDTSYGYATSDSDFYFEGDNATTTEEYTDIDSASEAMVAYAPED